MHYLDANASEPPRPEARAALLRALDVTGNPSSVHGPGRTARRWLEDAREALARRFGGRPEDLIFTSGGTEADALALLLLVALEDGTSNQGGGVLVGQARGPAGQAQPAVKRSGRLRWPNSGC